MADIERLVGSDGRLVTVTYGDEETGNGTDDLDDLVGDGVGSGEGWWEITQIADAGTAFPAALAVGDLFWDDGTMVLDDGTAVTGQPDKAKLLVETVKADITNFGLEINRAEIDVTTLSDDVKRYRSGKTDMTGSMEGITTLGTTDAAGYIINNFIRIVSQAAAGTVTVSAIDDSPIYIKGVIQSDTSTAGEQEAFIWARVNILSTSLGASGEDAQSFTSSFRIAPGDPDPTLYMRTIPT